MVTEEELEGYGDVASIESLDGVVVLVKPYVDYAKTMECMKKYGFSKSEMIMDKDVKGDSYYLFTK